MAYGRTLKFYLGFVNFRFIIFVFLFILDILDILLATNDLGLIHETKKFLSSNFEIQV